MLRKTRENTKLVDSAKANSDADFHNDSTVVKSFVEGVLDVASANQEFTDAILKDPDSASLMMLLQLLGFGLFLAGDAA